MERTTGNSILEQSVLGRLRFLQRPALELSVQSQLRWEEEECRLMLAQRCAVKELSGLYDQARRWVGHEVAAIFAIHGMLMEDEDFLSPARTMIREKGVTAEYAVQVVWGGFIAAFEDMESPYMRARAVDIRDISRRMLRHLLHVSEEDPLRAGPAILVVDELLPSEVMEFNHRRLLGVVAQRGSAESHTTLLLRACHIPTLIRVKLDQEWDGHLALMDEADQRLYLDPDWELMSAGRWNGAGKRPEPQPV